MRWRRRPCSHLQLGEWLERQPDYVLGVIVMCPECGVLAQVERPMEHVAKEGAAGGRHLRVLQGGQQPKEDDHG